MQAMNTNVYPPQIVDSKGIQELFGISETTLIRAKKRGEIPYMVINGTHRYNVSRVIQALEEKQAKKGQRR